MKNLENNNIKNQKTEFEDTLDLENIIGGTNLSTKLDSEILVPLLTISSSPTLAKNTGNSHNMPHSNLINTILNNSIHLNNINEVFENSIKLDLKNKEKFLNLHTDDKGNYLKNTWEGLCFLLGDYKIIKYVKENYPEWENV